jgi:hypothetical protein
MSVRDWPWWRLLVRVTPLLNVHRTEEELKIKTVSNVIFLVTILNVLCKQIENESPDEHQSLNF